jgi:CRISPR-associated endonuclease/helicase Cas3
MLIVLDEAHCSQPFEQTARAIDRYRRHAQINLPGPFQFVTMTATPAENDVEPFELEQSDREHPVLRKRLSASKPTRLLTPVGTAKDEKGQLQSALTQTLVEQAEALAANDLKVIGVMVNRVATARAVYAELEAKGHTALMLIGRMRPFDRDLIQTSDLFRQLMADKSETRALTTPIFVVATQTLEVGANLDFDGLVCECASLDAVRQRFGRLNRMGRDIPSQGVLVIRADDAKDSSEDPVYGAALSNTWKWFTDDVPAMADTFDDPTGKKGKKGKRKAKSKEDKQVDLGIDALQEFINQSQATDKDKFKALSQVTSNAPVMLPAHIDAWSQTSPMPMPSPDVAVFLHGPQRGAPEVQLVWRADLDSSFQNVWIDIVALCPPTSVEALQAPLYLVKQWLQGKITADNNMADVEGARLENESDSNQSGKTVLLWRGPRQAKKRNVHFNGSDDRRESIVTGNPNDILPGDTIVLPVKYGGWEIFGHVLNPTQPDIAETSRFKARRKLVLRLHPALLNYLPPGPARDVLNDAAQSEDKPDAGLVKAACAELAQSAPAHLRDLFNGMTVARLKFEEYPADDDLGAPGWVMTGTLPAEPAPVETPTDDDDELSLTAPPIGSVSLQAHVDGVTEFAVRFAEQCGLPPRLVSDFRLAGQFHDAGKADPRFQRWLYGCMERRYLSGRDELLGKSKATTEARKWQAQAESGYPKGSRHELLSVSLIQNDAAIRALAHDWDLVLHLIASHHGRCRPFAPVIDDLEPAQVEVELYGHALAGCSRTELERLDSGIAERFWRLTQKYGWWGLAYLESIFRLADHRQSQKDTGR